MFWNTGMIKKKNGFPLKHYWVYILYYLYLLLPQQLSFPTGIITVSSPIILTDAYTVGLCSSPTSTNCLHGVSTPEGCFPHCVVSCGFLPLTPSPGHWPLGWQPQMVNYLLSELWSPPLGAVQHNAVSEAAYWTSSQPTGVSNHLANNDSCSCQSGWATPSIFLSAG